MHRVWLTAQSKLAKEISVVPQSMASLAQVLLIVLLAMYVAVFPQMWPNSIVL